MHVDFAYELACFAGGIREVECGNIVLVYADIANLYAVDLKLFEYGGVFVQKLISRDLFCGGRGEQRRIRVAVVAFFKQVEELVDQRVNGRELVGARRSGACEHCN
ncbi:hypothetical protein SDC9_147246 [bioreactor metagenome]|uniref:Uncharacterized protein n=1 Tax=bioreactor metagenome TaxID=1076179 RepID=A0A645EFI7_9ZZZZ